MNHRNDVILWTLDLSGQETPPAAWLELLDEGERARCQRFRREKDRLAYAAAHALLRRTLSQTLALPPTSLMIARGTTGKPFLAMPEESGIDFSLSHTEGMVAVALSKAGKIGVDVESVDRKNLPREDFSAFGLSSDETAHLAALSEPERSEAFFDWWTAREAVAKADGRGLSLPFARIRMDRLGNSATIAAEETSPARRWRLWRERPSPRHCLALAWPEDGGELIRRGVSI